MEVDPNFGIYDFAEYLIKLAVSDSAHDGCVNIDDIEKGAKMFGVIIDSYTVLGLTKAPWELQLEAERKMTYWRN